MRSRRVMRTNNWRRVAVGLTLLAACGLAAPARAQLVESPPAAPVLAPTPPAVAPAAATMAAPVAAESRYGMSLREAWQFGGGIMWLLAAMSIFGGTLVIYFAIVLRPAQVAPRALLGEVTDHLRSGDLTEARRACENRSCALASVTLTALNYLRNAARTDAALLRDMIEAEGARQAEDLQSQTQLLLDVAVIAPMLGLLGTVLGMLKAFGSVAHDVAAAKPVILAQGVSQAIVTTIFGLMVAIPGMAFYAYFRRRASRLVSLLEGASAEVLTVLLGRPDA